MMLSVPAAQAASLPPGAEPSPGARAAVQHAAEAAAHQSLDQPVSLGRPSRLAIKGRWAFVIAPMRAADGGGFRYAAGTSRADDAAHGAVSRDYVVLLSWSGSAWSVVATAVGPTEPVWASWPATYGAPASLFPAIR